ncbi:MATE family efflux transporter [Guggenheimella bovis]
MNRKTNLTEGSIQQKLFKLALPIMGSAFIAMAYNLYDMYTVGHISADSVAAVGTGGFYLMLSFAIGMLTRTGGEVLTSQSIGAGDEEKARAFSQSAIRLAIFLSSIYAFFVFLFRDPLIGFFQISDLSVVLKTHEYLSVVIWSVPLTITLNALTGIFNAGGNSRAPFYASILGLITKIVLNFFLVNRLGFGIRGAALATVSAQFISVLTLLIVKARSSGYLKFIRFQRLGTEPYKKVLSLGAPAALQSLTFTLIAMYIGRLVSSFGKEAISVQRLGAQIESVSWMTSNGFGAALSAFVGQNYGAKKYDRAIDGFKVGTVIVALIGLCASLLLILLPRELFSIFIREDHVIEMGVVYLTILGISQFFQALEISTNGAFNGVGLTKFPSIIGISLQLLRIPSALFLKETVLGLSGIWWSISGSTVLKGTIGLLCFYLFVIRNLKKELN